MGFFSRWFCSTNYKDIGTLYLMLAICSALVGGAFSVIMRIQLMHPGSTVLADHQTYNVMMTAHGLIMVFFVVMPATFGGFGNWFVPLMIGAPDMAFPHRNNVSFWLLIPSLLLLVGSTFVRRSPAVLEPVLVLWSSRSLHPNPARLRDDLASHLDLLEEAGIRLSGHGLCNGGDRLHRLRHLGSSHVHDRHFGK